MAQSKNVYKTPIAGQPLITTITSGLRSPYLEVKFCNIINAYYYPNSPKTARYSITCVIDTEKDKEFLKILQNIEKNEKVDSIIKPDTVKESDGYKTSGNMLIKFQTKDNIPVYLLDKDSQSLEEATLLGLDDELARGERVSIVFDILRYTKKNTANTQHGISFKPSCVYLLPKEA